MKKIKELKVMVTYEAHLSDVEVSDEEYQALLEAFEGLGIIPNLEQLAEDATKCRLASQWLSEHVDESCACSCEFDIQKIEV